MLKKNLTIDLVNTFHKDYIIKEYEKLVKDEIDKYEGMLKQGQRFGNQNYQILQPGTVVNDGTLVCAKAYLQDYQLQFDPDVSERDKPIIAKITHSQFKDSLLKTDEDFVEKLINFSKSIPGFQYMNKSTARRLFFLFT